MNPPPLHSCNHLSQDPSIGGHSISFHLHLPCLCNNLCQCCHPHPLNSLFPDHRFKRQSPTHLHLQHHTHWKISHAFYFHVAGSGHWCLSHQIPLTLRVPTIILTTPGFRIRATCHSFSMLKITSSMSLEIVVGRSCCQNMWSLRSWCLW